MYRPYCKKLKAPTARFPWEKWLGRYEAYLLTLYGNRTFKHHWPTLERFFNRINPKWGLERITAMDINDYILWREATGLHPIKITIEINVLRKFWNWCKEEKGLNILSPILSAKNLQARYPDVFKAKSDSSPLAKVEVPTSNIRPTVIDDELYYDLIGGVA